MKPSIWPDWLEQTAESAILAKSLEKSIGDTPETLAEHTWAVLQRLSDFIHLRPNLPQEIGVPHLWNTLFWAAFIHDFGKAAVGFQNRLRGGEKWPHRHEVLSLACVDWLAGSFSGHEQVWLVAAIVSHHKDIHTIRHAYNRRAAEQVVELVAELPEPTLRRLWRWLNECPLNWAKALNLETFVIPQPLLMEEAAITQTQKNGADRIFYWLDVYYDFFEEELEYHPPDWLTTGTITLRGYLTNADHSASAHRGPLPHLTFSADQILRSRNINRDKLYQHQLNSETVKGSALLTAPTGSGKTEAALLWAAQQTHTSPNQPRLFYTLPYQASMNAMKLRLDETFGETMVGLQHGRAALAHYRMLLEKDDDDANPKNVIAQVKAARNMADLNYPPVRVFSPYQMLKGPYRLKGYEKLLSDYHHGLFIFDEIHAYEPKRLALIMETIKYLRLNFQARFMVMSATFPQLIKEILVDALGNATEIKAADKLFESGHFQRHRLRLKEGELLASLADITGVAQTGKSVLAACNRVAVAQEAYQYLQNALGKDRVDLLHGRFNMRDRSALEKRVRERAGANVTNPQPFVLVATQAVEVSLDIDLDTIFTEPAPLDALVQRFGRVNRRGKKGVAEVYVFKECDWEKQKYVYGIPLVEATLQVLEREQNQLINEQKIGVWLDEIYQGDIARDWRKDYQKAAQEFKDVWLNRLRAFDSVTNKAEQDFYRLFDGVEILPASLVAEYENLIQESRYLEASELLVPMRYSQLQNINASRKDSSYFDEGWPVVVDLPYNSDEEIYGKTGLDMSQAREPAPRTIGYA